MDFYEFMDKLLVAVSGDPFDHCGTKPTFKEACRKVENRMRSKLDVMHPSWRRLWERSDVPLYRVIDNMIKNCLLRPENWKAVLQSVGAVLGIVWQTAPLVGNALSAPFKWQRPSKTVQSSLWRNCILNCTRGFQMSRASAPYVDCTICAVATAVVASVQYDVGDLQTETGSVVSAVDSIIQWLRLRRMMRWIPPRPTQHGVTPD